MDEGKIIIVAGPSGAGKGTILKYVMEEYNGACDESVDCSPEASPLLWRGRGRLLTAL